MSSTLETFNAKNCINTKTITAKIIMTSKKKSIIIIVMLLTLLTSAIHVLAEKKDLAERIDAVMKHYLELLLSL